MDDYQGIGIAYGWATFPDRSRATVWNLKMRWQSRWASGNRADGQIYKTAKTHCPVRDTLRILSSNSASFVRTFSNHANDIAGFDLCKKVKLVAEYGSQDPVLHGWSPVDSRFDIICKGGNFAVLRRYVHGSPIHSVV